MKQFEIKEKQDEINKIDYWDGCVLDLQILYFGDEVHMYLEEYRENTCSLEECWKLSFIGCADVSYETDARERRTFKVKDFKKTQLYTCQDILLRYHDETFMKCTIVLEGLVILNIICRDIIVEKNNISNQDFFWKNNF
ncbi:hypothetical protein [Streptococcus ruminantium]|uniref:hypothetical protein n=1 Tax=Streptococcus ruminantium TaxID=1917441 RepID=UPI0012DED7D5|nr:hypothetical protein [Streptococcus ruminantium]BDD40598.1 hypothetical protein GUT184_08620 [Streptococcus ruminantium]BDD42845.1 hypothetical protein GUT189_11780 [Streptococcus ruminantium]